jgi:hypothetical protein
MNDFEEGERALEWPEDYLWVRYESGTLTIIRPKRLMELRQEASPTTPVETLIAANPDWLKIYLISFLGTYPITVPENGPLPDLGDPEGVLLESHQTEGTDG